MTGSLPLTVLAWDTSTVTTSAALVRWASGEPRGVVAAKAELDSATHSKNLIPTLNGLLEQAALNLDAVDLLAVGLGPGSFTGLRVGLATAQGLSWGGAKPAVGVNSLEVMARQAAEALPEAALIIPIMDARHQELFSAFFHWSPPNLTLTRDYLARPGPELERLIVQEAENLNLPPVLLGPGADPVNLKGARRLAVTHPSAEVLAALARLISPVQGHLEPCYLRPPAIRPGCLK